ncbi:MAG TPA: hypothetical protein VMR43_10290, partial [Variovorax sp.]|nr:hypothetical protein [Variovorax sp.]
GEGSSAAQWLRWIGAVALLGLPAVMMGPLAMTLDRTRWVALRTLVELMVRAPLVGWGALRFGIPGAIAGSAIATAAGTWTAMSIVRRLLGIGPGRQLVAFGPPLLAMLPAGALLHGSGPLVMAAEGPLASALRALPLGASYVLVYAAGVLLVWRCAGRPDGLERHLLDLVRQRFAPPSSTPPPKAITKDGHAEHAQ